jgi:hypothetical protein
MNAEPMGAAPMNAEPMNAAPMGASPTNASPVGRRTVRAAGVALMAGVLAAGCGSAPHQAADPGRHPVSLPLATSLAGSQATWAVVPMGAAAGPNLFWQLFQLPAEGTRWGLATPPDVATNGAIALGVQGGQGGRALVAGIHPSLLLNFSPITSTPDGGRTWSAGAPDPGLADVPDALATAPHGGQLIALDRDGSAELARSGQSSWKTLASTRSLAATPAGRACRPGGLTAVAFESSGAPAVGGSCASPGVAGIFADAGGSWHAAGPSLPVSLGRQQVQVLRLVESGDRLTALLQVGAGHEASLIAAWTTGDRWMLSPALRLAGLPVLSRSFGHGGGAAVALAGGRGDFLAGPGKSWQPLPPLPPGRAVTLALPAGGGVDALATNGSVLTAWRLSSGTGSGPGAPGAGSAGAWVQTQRTAVPIQYGSSS